MATRCSGRYAPFAYEFKWFASVIILSGDDRAISFTDERSPDTRRVTGEKICIDGQVIRDLSLDWYYKIIQRFPDVLGELKSKEVAERFRTFPAEIRNPIWVGLGQVKIRIVDPRSHRHKINNILRRAWKNEDAPKLLNRWEKEGMPYARSLSAQLREMVANLILHDSTARRVEFLGRALLDPIGMVISEHELKPYFARSEKPSKPVISTEDFRKPKSLIRDAASWTAKSSAVFHSALDAILFPDEDATMTYRFGPLLRRKMAEELLPVHAFDDGNRKQLDLLEEARTDLPASERSEVIDFPPLSLLLCPAV